MGDSGGIALQERLEEEGVGLEFRGGFAGFVPFQVGLGVALTMEEYHLTFSRVGERGVGGGGLELPLGCSLSIF